MMKKVLIVDDNDAIRQVMYLLLTDNGYKVNLAYSYLTALSMIQCEKPDFIFLDVVLCNEDGRKICKKLKEDEETKDICIIIFSGYENQFEDFKKYNADWVMDKYSDVAEYLHVLNVFNNKDHSIPVYDESFA